MEGTNPTWWHPILESGGRGGWEFGIVGLLSGRIIKLFVYEKFNDGSFIASTMAFGMSFHLLSGVAKTLFPPKFEKPSPLDQAIVIVIRIWAIVTAGNVFYFCSTKKFVGKLLINGSLLAVSIFTHYTMVYTLPMRQKQQQLQKPEPMEAKS